MVTPRCFVGGATGTWRVVKMTPVVGPPLAPAERVQVFDGNVSTLPAGAVWLLRGVTSYARYVTGPERDLLRASQPELGRPEATCAALIPIGKTAEWWDLPADERRAILETRSAHIQTGLKYLPAIARQLLHGRDLGEPFDFLTWFEYAPADAEKFDDLLATLRASEEWSYVDREVDLRLVR